MIFVRNHIWDMNMKHKMWLKFENLINFHFLTIIPWIIRVFILNSQCHGDCLYEAFWSNWALVLKMVLFIFLTKKLEEKIPDNISLSVWTNKRRKASEFLNWIQDHARKDSQAENLCYFWLEMRTNLMWT